MTSTHAAPATIRGNGTGGQQRRLAVAESPARPPAAGEGGDAATGVAAGAAGEVGRAGCDQAAGDARRHVARLYREVFPALFGYIRFRVGDPHLAEDLTALVFERALSRLATVRDPARIRAWLFSIARNAIADARRARRAQQPPMRLEAAELIEAAWAESPEADALRREERRQLSAHVAALGQREREVIGLKFVAGLTNREIAAVLALSEANAGQILHRTLLKLRRRFDDGAQGTRESGTSRESGATRETSR